MPTLNEIFGTIPASPRAKVINRAPADRKPAAKKKTAKKQNGEPAKNGTAEE
jgi:hypothetical protein